MKKIKLKWAKNENSYNFGDDLSPYLINKLSGNEVEYIMFADSKIKVVRHLFSIIYRGNFSHKVFKDFIKSIFLKKYIISIGSIIQWYSSNRCIVWGSGIIDMKGVIRQSNFLAVRGHYTRNLILKQGMSCPEVFGDPALLTPLVYLPKVKKSYKLGIIPHVTHFDLISENILIDDVLIINLNSRNIEEVIDQINMCEITICTSLHGVILSHAYNIKSLWFGYEGVPLLGDNVKFLDYFSSVKIPEYKPFFDKFDKSFDADNIVKIVNDNSEINSIGIDINSLQQKLLSVAPFFVKSEFCSK